MQNDIVLHLFIITLIIHGFPANLQANKDGFKQFICLLWIAFPYMRITFDDIIIEGDKVAGIYNLNWHNKDEFIDLQPTNKQFRVDV